MSAAPLCSQSHSFVRQKALAKKTKMAQDCYAVRSRVAAEHAELKEWRAVRKQEQECCSVCRPSSCGPQVGSHQGSGESQFLGTKATQGIHYQTVVAVPPW